MGYRVSTNDYEPPTLVKRWWGRPLCWIIGHRWHVIRINMRKNIGLAHLSPWAGIDQFCTRCGAEWYDAHIITQGFQLDPGDNKQTLHQLEPPSPIEPHLSRLPKLPRLSRLTRLQNLSDAPFDSAREKLPFKCRSRNRNFNFDM